MTKRQAQGARSASLRTINLRRTERSGRACARGGSPPLTSQVRSSRRCAPFFFTNFGIFGTAFLHNLPNNPAGRA